MKKVKTLSLVVLISVGLVISVLPASAFCKAPKVEGWTITVNRGSITGNPDLVEYVWTANRPPGGLYDKIAVHRVVRADGKFGQDVVFILPGTLMSGEQIIHMRKDGVQYVIPNENYSIALYLARRGFDVYTIDYRTHFVPFAESDQAFMLNWGWDAWLGDIKAAVNLIKAVSSVCKIYIAGESFGGGAAMNYASLYWKEDLKGIILLDPAYCQVAAKRGEETNTYNLTKAIEEMTTVGIYISGVLCSYSMSFDTSIFQYALAHPEQTDLWAGLMYGLYLGGYVNPFDYPWSQPLLALAFMATLDNYWPSMLWLESFAYMDWVDCPYLPYDFDDHFAEIDVPVIGFVDERYWPVIAAIDPNFGLYGKIVNGVANPDLTGIFLEGHGHLDVYVGTYSRERVNEPTYQWLLDHRMLVGFGGICIDGCWRLGKTTVYINATVIDFKVESTRTAWNIVDHCTYKNLEVYKGEGQLGLITVLVYKECAVANGQKVFFFGQKV
jgi:pimeloyl-ACP methyl ester carboxylesterase